MTLLLLVICLITACVPDCCRLLLVSLSVLSSFYQYAKFSHIQPIILFTVACILFVVFFCVCLSVFGFFRSVQTQISPQGSVWEDLNAAAELAMPTS